jgi:hypothetical protein
MLTASANTEHDQRDRFIAAVTETRYVYAVAGEDGLARVPSQTHKDRDVTLLWSNAQDAQRWASVVATNPRIKNLPLTEVLSGLLPGLNTNRRLVGLDWSSQPVDSEFEPLDVAERIRAGLLDRFVQSVRQSGRVWTLENAGGPALLVSRTSPDKLIMPCWSEAGAAYAWAEGPWRDMVPLDIPFADFLTGKLAWLTWSGHLVAPEHCGGPGSFELAAADLRARFEAAMGRA